ncbi:MAG: penicillin-binding protein activator [Pseudomonadota bacterium]
MQISQSRNLWSLPAAWRALGRMAGAALLCASVAACATSSGSSGGGQGSSQKQPPRISGIDGGEARRGAPGAGAFVEPGSAARVALLAPLGDNRAPIREIAQSLTDSAQLALRDMGDPLIDLRIYDTGGTQPGAAQAATRAVQDGASIMIGPLFATSITAAGPVAAQAGLPMISFSTDASVAGGNVFLIGFLPQQEIERVITYAAAQGVTNVAALTPQTDFGRLAAGAVQQSAALAGARVSALQPYEPTFQGVESGVKTYVETHQLYADSTDPIQAVLLPSQGQELQTLGAYLAYYDVNRRNTQFLGTGGWNNPVTLKEPSLRGGVFASPDPLIQERFYTRFETAFGRRPHPLGALGYDAMAAIGAMTAEARSAGSPYPFSVEAITAPAGYVGVNGVFRFLPSGLNERELAILEVTPTGFEVVDPAATSFAGY